MLENMAYFECDTSFSTYVPRIKFRKPKNQILDNICLPLKTFFLSNSKTFADLSLKSWKVRSAELVACVYILFCLVSGRDQKMLCFTESHAALFSTKHANFFMLR